MGLDRGTALLCLVVLASTICVGAFVPLLPDIARAQGLPDWELGVLAGSFGFARMAADLPVGALASRRLAAALVAAPFTLLIGMLLLATAGPLPVLVMGRMLTGLAHTLVMVGSLTAVLRERPGPGASFRLNTLEFAGMLGVLGGLVLVGTLPEGWRWNLTLLVACGPLLAAIAGVLALRRHLAAAGDAPETPAGAARARRATHVRARRHHGARVVRGEPVRDPAARHARVRPRARRHLGAPLAVAAGGPPGAVAGGLARGSHRSPTAAGRGCRGAGRGALRGGSGLTPRGGARVRALRAQHGGVDAAARRDPRAHRPRAARLAHRGLSRGRGRGDLPGSAHVRCAGRGAHAVLHRTGWSGRLRDRAAARAAVAVSPSPRPLPGGERVGPEVRL